MNTPLLSRLAAAAKAVTDAYITIEWSKPAQDHLTPLENAELALKHIGDAFVLDWRRFEDGLPDGDTTVFVAIENDPEVWLGYIGEGNRWYAIDGMPIEGRVYAFAEPPAAPKPEHLIGFAPRPHAPAAPAPAPRAG